MKCKLKIFPGILRKQYIKCSLHINQQIDHFHAIKIRKLVHKLRNSPFNGLGWMTCQGSYFWQHIEYLSSWTLTMLSPVNGFCRRLRPNTWVLFLRSAPASMTSFSTSVRRSWFLVLLIRSSFLARIVWYRSSSSFCPDTSWFSSLLTI